MVCPPAPDLSLSMPIRIVWFPGLLELDVRFFQLPDITSCKDRRGGLGDLYESCLGTWLARLRGEQRVGIGKKLRLTLLGL